MADMQPYRTRLVSLDTILFWLNQNQLSVYEDMALDCIVRYSPAIDTSVISALRSD